MNTFIDRVNAIVQQNQQPTMSAPTEPAYPDAGIGALENVANNVPRQAQLMNQPHMLAYINPQEEQALRDMGGAGLPGPDGIPVYGFFDWASETASNIGSSIRDTASNVYDTVSTGLSNTFGDQGYIETAVDKIYDFDGDSTPATGTTGTTGTNATTATNEVVREPSVLELSMESTKTQAELEAEARAAGQASYMFQGNYYSVSDEVVVPDEVVDPVETTNSVVSQDLGQKFDQYGNSVRETIANLITPFDSAYYEDGTLYGYDKDGNVIDLTGGGESYNSLTGTSNYVYGVSDDAETGTALDTIGMSDDEVSTAQVSDELLRDIPPSDLAYFGSFFANRAIPIFGGYLAGKMLDSGIEDRRAIMDAEIAALEAGATPRYNDANEYIGHYTEEDDLANTFGSGNIYTENYEGASTVNYGLDESNKVIGDGSYVKALDDLEGGSSAQIFSDGDPVIKSIYNRFRISGSTAGLPIYMSKWMDGVDFDERLEKVMVDGKVMYKNAEGDVISAEDLKNALMYDDDGNIIETEE